MEIVRENTPSTRDLQPIAIRDLSAEDNLTSTTVLETTLIAILTDHMEKTEAACKAKWGSTRAPATVRRTAVEMGGWIIEDVIGKCTEKQWADMVGNTIKEHIERVTHVQYNGDWRIESVQPVQTKHVQNMPLSGKLRVDGFQEYTGAPAGYKQQRLDKLVMRVVLVDLRAEQDIQRVNGAEVSHANAHMVVNPQAAAAPNVTVQIDGAALREAMGTPQPAPAADSTVAAEMAALRAEIARLKAAPRPVPAAVKKGGRPIGSVNKPKVVPTS